MKDKFIALAKEIARVILVFLGSLIGSNIPM